MTKVQSISATQHAGMYQPPSGCPCWHTIQDAARALGVSVSTVRRAVARQTGVKVIHGPSVAGMVELQCGHSRTGYMPYHE